MIWTILKTLIPGAWKWLAAAGAALVGILGIYAKGSSDAKAKFKAKQAEARIETMEKANEVRSAIDAKSDAAVRGDLGKWVRPE